MSSKKRGVKKDDDFKSSHNMEGKYAVLQEFNDEESESWLYFIRWEGNEDALRKLQEQLETIEWYLMEDCSTFDLDIENLVSPVTAKEMTKVDLNAHQWHRKFDGKLKTIKFKFKPKHKNERKMLIVFDKLGDGRIDEYIDDEDIDTDDITEGEETDGDDGDDRSLSSFGSRDSSDGSFDSDDEDLD